MQKAYEYNSDFVAWQNGTGAEPLDKSNEYDNAATAATRESNIIVRNVERQFTPYIPPVTREEITLDYPSDITLSYNGTALAYTTSGGRKSSAMSITEDSTMLIISPATAMVTTADVTLTDAFMLIPKRSQNMALYKAVTLSFTADNNITGALIDNQSLSGSMKLAEKASYTLNISYTDGYKDSGITVTGGTASGSNGTYTITPTAASVTIEATSTQQTETITHNVTVNVNHATVTIDGVTTTTGTITDNGSATVVITPDSGYSMTAPVAIGVCELIGNDLLNVKSDITITATTYNTISVEFISDTTVTYDGNTVSGTVTVPVSYAGVQKTISADGEIQVTGGYITTVGNVKYLVLDDTPTVTVEVTSLATARVYNVLNATVTYNGVTQTKRPYGGSQERCVFEFSYPLSFTITADEGYIVRSVLCQAAGGENVKSFSNGNISITTADTSEDELHFDVVIVAEEVETESESETLIDERPTLDEVLSATIIQEVSYMADKLPYSSVEFETYDNTNDTMTSTNQLDFDKGSAFEVWATAKDADVTGNPYITKLGTYYLDSVDRGNETFSYSLIGNIERYDNIYLSEAEREMSSYVTKVKIKEYLQTLFGSDIDVSNIADHWQMITPFAEESKSEIARIVAQYLGLTLYENVDGKISFANNDHSPTIAKTVNNNPVEFCIHDTEQSMFPVVKTVAEKIDSVDVKTHTYVADVQQDMNISTNELYMSENGTDYIKIAAIQSDGSEIYYDRNGNEISEGQYNNYITSRDIKYLRQRLIYDTHYDERSILVSAANDDEYLPLDKRLAQAKVIIDDPEYANQLSVKATADYLDIIAPANAILSDPDRPGHTMPKEYNDQYTLILAFIIITFFQKYKGRPIKELTRDFTYAPQGTKNSTLTVDNKLISNYNAAQELAYKVMLKRNASTDSVTLNWRENGRVGLTDIVAFDASIGRDDDRRYGYQYLGQIIKTEIDYDGALSARTELRYPEQYMYACPTESGTYNVAVRVGTAMGSNFSRQVTVS